MAGSRPFRKVLHDRLGLHEWIVDPLNSMKRHCSCGAEEWVFSKRFPKIGEAKYSWRRIDLPEQAGLPRHMRENPRKEDLRDISSRDDADHTRNSDAS